MVSGIEEAQAEARAGRWNKAEAMAREILRRDPQNMDAIEITALARRNAGNLAEAEALLRRAIATDPAKRWPYGDLTRLLMERGRPFDAEIVARSALAADNGNADAHMLLGRLLVDRGLGFEGAHHLRASIALVGRHPELLTALGQALSQQGRLGEAREVLEESIRSAPGQLVALCALAETEERARNFEKASFWLDRADVLAQRLGTDTGLQRSQLLSRQGRAEEALAILTRSQRLSGAALLQRGRLLDRLGRHGDAWRDWTEGKAAIAAVGNRIYRAEEEEAEARRLRGFAEARSNAAHFEQDARAKPVFILGFPRSGTTLVEQILAAHSAIAAGGELPFVPELRDLAEIPGNTSGEAHRRHYLARANSYGLCSEAHRFFTDKMPLNEFYLPLIRAAFPDAAVIRVVRHPLDVLVSVMSHDMTHGQNCGYRLVDAARHFALIQRQIEAFEAAGLSIDHTLRYESLVDRQEEETRALMSVLGLEMDDRQLAFHELERHAPTPSYAQVREPLNDRSIGRWRNFEQDLAPAIPLVRGAMEALGYEG